MPELPEVESTVQYLKERVEGVSIREVAVHWKRTIATHTTPTFIRELRGRKIRSVFRRGKFIGIELEGTEPRYLFVHLRMSGSLDVIATDNALATHDRVVITLDNGKSIRFNDTRKFGRMYLCKDPNRVVGALGVEPLSDEFSCSHLSDLLTSKSGGIKQLLLNQSVIAGLGNIYVDEVLWKSHIHPQTAACLVTPEQVGLLHTAIKETLTEAISLAGTDFGDGVVYGGMYTPVVYGRDGEPCHRCGETIKKTVIGQRGTHLCPRCQKRRRARRTKRAHGVRRTTSAQD
jgi:formamidopyrimidine-DNA glycosylase